MVNKCRRPSWIYGKLASFHQLDFRGFLLCFSFVYSELFGALFLVIQWILIDLIIFIIQVFLFIIKNQFWLLKICPPYYIFVDFLYVM